MPIADEILKELPDSELECLRCPGTPMKEAGEARFLTAEDSWMRTSRLEPLQVLVCPRCGKVETFV